MRAATRRAAVFRALSSTSFNPPQWLRIVGSTFLPIGLFGAVVSAALAWRAGHRGLGLVGIALAIVAVAGLIVLVNMYE